MGQTLNCISPIDGSVYASRETLSRDEGFATASAARAAQKAWAARPLQERIDLVMAGVAAVGAMNDEIVPELAHMMGRPVRYGGEFGGFNERSSAIWPKSLRQRWRISKSAKTKTSNATSSGSRMGSSLSLRPGTTPI